MKPEIELELMRKVKWDMGIHPASITDSKGVNTPRDRYGDGWNDALTEIYAKEKLLKDWYKALPEDIRKDMDDLVLSDVVDFNLDELEKKEVDVWVNLNDTFCYACADGEGVELSELSKLNSIFKRFGHDGVVAYFSIKLGIDPIKKRMNSKFKEAREIIRAEQDK